MFLNSREQRALTQCFTVLAQDLSAREIRAQIASPLLDLFRADQFASFVWRSVTGRSHFDDCVALNMSEANLAHYTAWYQYCDPITFLLQSKRQAACVSEVMPRRDFVRTAFFNDFLAADGLHWGMNLHAFDGDLALGDLRIWRGKSRRDFDDHDKQLLNLIEPVFVAALKRTRVPPATRFERPTLSLREREVMRCICQGMTDKEIAKALLIGLPTVRTYVQRLFEKLGVHRRASIAHIATRLQ